MSLCLACRAITFSCYFNVYHTHTYFFATADIMNKSVLIRNLSIALGVISVVLALIPFVCCAYVCYRKRWYRCCCSKKSSKDLPQQYNYEQLNQIDYNFIPFLNRTKIIIEVYKVSCLIIRVTHMTSQLV